MADPDPRPGGSLLTPGPAAGSETKFHYLFKEESAGQLSGGNRMEISRFNSKLRSYGQWKQHLSHTMNEYQRWLKKYRLLTRDSAQRIDQCRRALAEESLTVAFVAEFSRGKTELINAIFFADYGRRLLPSAAGRTTMCPTEMFYDRQADSAYVRLLPIETRLQETPLEALKQQPEAWIQRELDLTSADQIEAALGEVVQSRQVPVQEAIRLGLYDPADNPQHEQLPETVEIPRWRHALISFPHPLLKQGLVILDTPGLNALGSEPELTLSMLPSAQAILFVLAADTGVTRSDLEMWRNHVRSGKRRRNQGLMVVLNKIDTLWDELQDGSAIDRAIERQCRESADILGIPRSNIFPVSAHKGLLGKVKGDRELLRRSALPALEEYLSRELLDSRREIVRDTVSAEISHMLESTIGIVVSKQRSIRAQLEEFRGLSGKSREVIEHLMTRTRAEQAAYIQDVNSFNASRDLLREQSQRLMQMLDLEQLEQRIEAAQKEMRGAWTTRGLRRVMQALFDELRDDMQTLVGESEQARKTIRSIYRRFQSQHDFSVVQPRMFSVMRFRVELEMLYQEAEIFRNSPVMAVTEKHFVVRRFLMSLVGRARMIFTTARREVAEWLDGVLDPLSLQIEQHREQMETRLQDLQKISRSRDTLERRVAELQKQERAVERQLLVLRNLYNRINTAHPPSPGQDTKPRLVS